MTADPAAAALLQRFSVWGRYYEARLDGAHWPARSHLEIVDRAARAGDGRGATPDLVAVMMNPGGSRPLHEPDAGGWAPALPDRTQYQLMKLALRMQARGCLLRHIRVVNLSDLRTPKSAELFAALVRLRDAGHSLFAPSRATERADAFGPAGVPVLRAWGLAPALASLATLALEATHDRPVLGLTDDGWRYRHPLPQRTDLQRQWLDAVSAQAQAVLGPITGTERHATAL